MSRVTARHVSRLKTLVGAAALAAGAALIVAPAASATTAPFPAGTTTINTAGTFSFTVLGTATPVSFSATMTGTSDGAGHLTFPKAQVHFPTVTTTLLSNTAHIVITPTTNWAATINTSTGAVTLSGTFTTLISVEGALAATLTNCGLGPITPALSTANSGGVKYKKVGTHATATVIDHLFAVPSPTDPDGTCSNAALVGTALGTPIAQGDSTAPHARYISGALTIYPPGVAAPTTTTSTSTTVPVKTGAPTVEAGKAITVTGNGWKPGSTVTILLTGNATPLGTATVDANGAFSASVTIPSDTAAGAHTITITGTDPSGVARTVQSGTITVTAILPATGGDTGPLTLLGVALVSAGAVMLAPRRRRRRMVA